MALNLNPVFRKNVAPWYDTEVACHIQMAFMVIVILFSIVGLFTVLDSPAFNNFFAIPVLLFLLSGYVLISTKIRLVKRNTTQDNFL